MIINCLASVDRKHRKEVLTKFFLRNQYPSRKERQMLATQLNLNTHQVYYWFEYQRTKLKKSRCPSNQHNQVQRNIKVIKRE